MTALSKLTLTDFRNHAAFSLNIESAAVCLFGENGAGKTNILEALSLLGPGRGLRSASLNELVRQGSERGWTVSAVFDDDHQIGIGLDQASRTPKRAIRVDGAAATTNDLAERVRMIWVTPAMDVIFRGGGTERRRFLDRQVMANIPSHGRVSAAYEKSMRERNALLERNYIDPAWADAVENRMAEAGAIIAMNRAMIVRKLQAAVNARPDGYFPKSDLSISGEFEKRAADGASLSDLEEALRDTLAAGRARDRAAGRTLNGPHRSDLDVIHRPSGAAASLASTGQQKALLIGLILANARALSTADEQAPAPLILLDEAAAHLDPSRRAALFDELSSLKGQAWLTGTDATLFDAFRDRAQLVEVPPTGSA